jgi:hypothetical protein
MPGAEKEKSADPAGLEDARFGRRNSDVIGNVYLTDRAGRLRHEHADDGIELTGENRGSK